jgi:hypothetical protein
MLGDSARLTDAVVWAVWAFVDTAAVTLAAAALLRKSLRSMIYSKVGIPKFAFNLWMRISGTRIVPGQRR